MRNFWLSWEHDVDKYGGITLHSPWWISGWNESVMTIVAAIKANSEKDAISMIINSFDKPANGIEFRFISEKQDGWSPFCLRFPQAHWMEWTDESTCQCLVCKPFHM